MQNITEFLVNNHVQQTRKKHNPGDVIEDLKDIAADDYIVYRWSGIGEAVNSVYSGAMGIATGGVIEKTPAYETLRIPIEKGLHIENGRTKEQLTNITIAQYNLKKLYWATQEEIDFLEKNT